MCLKNNNKQYKKQRDNLKLKSENIKIKFSYKKKIYIYYNSIIIV